MATLFALLFLLSFICLVVGLIAPQIFTFLFKKRPTRRMVGLIFGIATLLFMVLFGMVDPNKSSTPTTEDTFAVIKNKADNSSPIPTPTTDPNTRCNAMWYDHEAQQLCYQEVQTEQRMLNAGPDLKATSNSNVSGIYFTNTENVDYKGCTAYIGNDPTDKNAFSSDIGLIPAHGTIRAGWETFANSDGERFNYFTTKPNSVTLECNDNADENKFRDEHFIL